jgi:hypothetical protein
MRRFLRVIAMAATGFLALLGILYLTQGLVGSAHVKKAKEQAAADLTAALPSAQVEATAARERVRASLSQLGAPTNSWQELVCELETNDSGWVVNEYVQQCDIRSVDLIPTTRAAAGDCENLYFPEAIQAANVGFVGVWRGRSTVLAAERSWEHNCPDGLTGPPLIGTSRLLQGRRSENLSASSGWIVVVTTSSVSRTVLGCNPWAILFCSEPIDTPVMSAE